MTEPVRIAHISDIHFQSNFAHSQWDYVRAVLRHEQPNLVVATGDFVEHPWPLMLVLARREILDLEKYLGVTVLTISGNHDVAFFGSFTIPIFSRLFGAIFSGSHDDWIISEFPSFSEFYKKGVFKRFFFSIYLNIKIFIRWITFRLRRPPTQDDLGVPDTNLPVCIVTLDSNDTLLLAAGRVNERQINQLGKYALRFFDPDYITTALHPRIALIHHHLVPIPYTRSSIAGHETFLVLRNAGTILRELWNHDFDLVLHGHRHYSSFSRIAYGSVGETGRTMGVLSAASPTVREPESGSNSIHIINLHLNGGIQIREIRFGSEMTIAGPTRSEETWIEALSFHAIKVRNFRRLQELQGFTCEEFTRELDINSDGLAKSRRIIRNLKPRPGHVLKDHLMRVKVDRGIVNSNAFNEIREDNMWSTGCNLTVAANNPKDVRANITFLPPLVDNMEVSFGIQFVTSNAYAMSHWEMQTFPQKHEDLLPSTSLVGEHKESMSVRIRFPIRKLRIMVKLPSNLVNPDPDLVCLSPFNYPALKMDDRREIEVPKPPVDQSPWIYDSVATEYEKRNFRPISTDTWEWTVQYPLVGYMYQIRWHVEDVREKVIDISLAGETETYRKQLLNYAVRTDSESQSSTSQDIKSVRKQIETLILEPIYSLVSSSISKSETFRVCIFVFDSNSNDLVAVEEATRGPGLGLHKISEGLFRIPFGEGIAGLTFKRCQAAFYYLPATKLHHGSELELFRQGKDLGLKAILGIPLYHPDAWKYAHEKLEKNENVTWPDLPSIYQAIGVITLASDSESTGLSALMDDRKRDSLLKQIFSIINDITPNMLNIFLKSPLDIS